MSRRRRRGTMISLFAFQDIIMSVSGIVIMMVLLLSLQLVHQRPATGAAARADRKADLTELLAALEPEVGQLRDEMQKADQLIRDVAGTSLAELRNDIESIQELVDRLRREIGELEKQASALASAEGAMAPHRSAMEAAKREIETLRRKVAQLKQQAAEERREDRVVYSLPRGFDKDGWLVLIESGRVSAAPLGRTAAPTVFTGRNLGALSLESATNKFLTWARSHTSRQSYFLLLVRPSGVDAFDAIEESFNQRGVSFGFDLVGEHEAVLHPERGASP